MEQRRLLEEDQHHRTLRECNHRQRMKELVDGDRFRPSLADVFGRPRTRGRGRRSWEYLVILRCRLRGVMNGLSDEQLHPCC